MPDGKENSARLDSWKDIATYLRRDVRTVIRWEKEKGLPVRRVPGGRRQAVFAYTSELDAWLTDEGSEPQGLKLASGAQGNGTTEVMPFPRAVLAAISDNRKLRYYALAGLVIVSGSLFARFGLRSRGAGESLPARAAFTSSSMQALDQQGHVLWTHPFPRRVADHERLGGDRLLADAVRVADFRGDGEREVLAIVPQYVEPNADSPDRWEVVLFSSQGQLLWSYVPHGKFQFGEHEVTGTWVARDLLVSSHEGRTQIWLAAIHRVWGHGFVVNLDPVTGKDTLRFVNTGTIHALNELKTPQGNFLLAGGFNNEGDSGSLAVVNEAKPFAVSPQSPGTRHKCKNCPAGDPDYFFVFPRSEINELEQVYEDGVRSIVVTDDQIEVSKNELQEPAPLATLYLLKADGGLRVVSRAFGSGYDMLHRKFEQEGRLNHSLENCPERLHPRPIKVWTPVDGWTEIRLEPGRAS